MAYFMVKMFWFFQNNYSGFQNLLQVAIMYTCYIRIVLIQIFLLHFTSFIHKMYENRGNWIPRKFPLDIKNDHVHTLLIFSANIYWYSTNTSSLSLLFYVIRKDSVLFFLAFLVLTLDVSMNDQSGPKQEKLRICELDFACELRNYFLFLFVIIS